MTALQSSWPAEGESTGQDPTGRQPPFSPDPRPDAETAWRRLRLALSLLSHRPWCPACQRHARQVEQALNGEPIDQINEGA